jgi:hypothetical protein
LPIPREAVKVVLSRLPDAQREVLALYYFAELTLPEIATALNRNPNTIKYQFYRANAQRRGLQGRNPTGYLQLLPLICNQTEFPIERAIVCRRTVFMPRLAS